MDRPILFSAAMVRALLDGRKGQTRRIVKPQPSHIVTMVGADDRPTGEYGLVLDAECPRVIQQFTRCPYGVPGDRLWVRESGKIARDAYDVDPALGKDLWRDVGWVHAADGALVQRETLSTALAPLSQWIGDCALIGRPSIHMPRWASRLTLTITDVRVERLQDISEADARAEGITAYPDGFHWEPNPEPSFCRLIGRTAKLAFLGLWEEINGRESVDANPWVWVLSFDVERRNVDEARP